MLDFSKSLQQLRSIDGSDALIVGESSSLRSDAITLRMFSHFIHASMFTHDHVRCKCGSQFCYLCDERWKTCRYATWDENRLLARANIVAARRPIADPPRQAARIQDAVQNLRQRHLCDHQSWQYVRGPHQFEECHGQLTSYIFECRQCNIQACNRCKLNRL